MKVTRDELKKAIKEEIGAALTENDWKGWKHARRHMEKGGVYYVEPASDDWQDIEKAHQQSFNKKERMKADFQKCMNNKQYACDSMPEDFHKCMRRDKEACARLPEEIRPNWQDKFMKYFIRESIDRDELKKAIQEELAKVLQGK